MVGMGKAVRHGIWYKDAAAMEEAARVDTVVLDKTGTLTEGRPQIAAVWLAEEKSPLPCEAALLSGIFFWMKFFLKQYDLYRFPRNNAPYHTSKSCF